MRKEAYVGDSQGWGAEKGDLKERAQLSDDGRNSNPDTEAPVSDSECLAHTENQGMT